MKKTVLFAAALLAAAVANAQVITSTSFTKNKAKTIWYIKAGATFAKAVLPDYDLEEGEKITSYGGYNIGIAFDAPIGSKGVFWNMGLQLASKGFKYKYKDEGEYHGYKYSDKGSTSLKINKIELPLSFGYKYAVNNDITVDARLGAFVNYDLFGKEKYAYEEIYDGEKESDKGSEKLDMSEYTSALDRLGAGMYFGVGVWYRKFNFNITYQGGMRKQDGPYGLFKERNCMLSLGYAF